MRNGNRFLTIPLLFVTVIYAGAHAGELAENGVGLDCSNPDYIVCEDFEWSDDPDYYAGGNSNVGDWEENGWDRFNQEFQNKTQPNGAKAGEGYANSIGVITFQKAGEHSTGGIYPSYTFAKATDGYDELYVQWKTKWSANYVWDYSTTKNFYVRSISPETGKIDWRVPMFINGAGEPSPELYATYSGWYDNKKGTGPADRWLNQNQGNDIAFVGPELGKWHTMEFYIKVETRKSGPGQEANGVFKLWIDGVLRTHLTNVQFRNADSQYSMNEVWISSYWGGKANSGSFPNQYVWWDDIIVSKSYIGVGDEVAPKEPSAFSGWSE